MGRHLDINFESILIDFWPHQKFDASWGKSTPGKLNQNGAKRGQGRSKMGPRGLTWSQIKGGRTCCENRFGDEKVANMAAK